MGEGVALGELLWALAEGLVVLVLDPTRERLRSQRAEVSPRGAWHPRHAAAGLFTRWRHVPAPAGRPLVVMQPAAA